MTLDIDAIRARAEAATEGPWGQSSTDPDVAFLINAREDVLALIAEVERLRKADERQRRLLGSCQGILNPLSGFRKSRGPAQRALDELSDGIRAALTAAD
jgi:hypothetical protein